MSDSKQKAIMTNLVLHFDLNLYVLCQEQAYIINQNNIPYKDLNKLNPDNVIGH